jgi:hypothetical protein
MKALGKGSIASIVRIGLQIAWIVLWILAALLVVGAIAYAGLLVLIANGAIDPSVLQGGDGHVRIGEAGSGTFNVEYDRSGGGTWPVVVPSLLIGGVAVAGSLIIVWRLRRLFDSFTSGEPFQRENATHLRVIWITMAAIEIARYLLTASTAGLLILFGESEGVVLRDVDFRIDFSTWGSILILIVLAEVFREGARLKEEQELTI